MKFDVKAAKSAGYSDSEINDFLSKSQPKPEAPKQFDAEAAKSAGYTDKEITAFLKKEQLSKTKSVGSAAAKGLLKGLEDISNVGDPIRLAINVLAGQQPSQFRQLTEKFFPTRDEALEGFVERAAELLPSAAIGGGGVLSTLGSVLGGATLGELAKQEGVGELGQGVSEAVGMGLPGIAKAIGKGAINLFKSPIQKLPSGITAPRAIGSKFAERGIVSKNTQERAIQNLNKEASELTKKTIHKELPLIKKIEQGFDFEGNFEKRFGSLEKLSEKANPSIDLTPVSEFLSSTAKKYRGIPKLHPEGAKVVSEIRAFGNRPQTEMKKLLRVYRSNNKKIRNIYETSRLTGKQAEYVDFLVDYNRSIGKAFEDTLPKDSSWIKEFRGLNREYKQYKDALKTMSSLGAVLEERATPAAISKIADDAKLQKKLSLSLGESGAKEVAQIAKDLRLASEAIKRIPAKDLKWYESILPLSVFVPGGKAVTGAISAKKGLDFLRRGYGWLLSTPKRRSIYNDILKSFASDNRPAYVKAVQELEKLLQEDEED